MKIIHFIIERTLIAAFALCFAFVALYIPQIHEAEAGGPLGGATEPTQILNNVQLGLVNAATSISSIADPITSAMTSSSFVLDNVIDGVAWSLAKSVVSEMTSSILNWVNSGFKGSPAFITDMRGFLTDIADREFGALLEELGGPFSFICAPFKLDVQVAIATTYEAHRANGGVATPATCTLSGALANIEGFLDGTEKFSEGGWAAWLKISAQPETYTGYGATMGAKIQGQARIVNARGEEVKLLEFGDGFLSSKICEEIEGSGSSKERCTITTPGKVINEALTFQTSAGPRSLIEADEINEIISAVFSQLAQKAITGAAGLLGLSGGTGYTYSGVPFTDQLATYGFTSDPAQLYAMLEESYNTEVQYRALAETYEPLLEAYADDLNNPADRRNAAREAYNEIAPLIVKIIANSTAVSDLIDKFDAMVGNDPVVLQEITTAFFALDLHSEVEVDGQESRWKTLIR